MYNDNVLNHGAKTEMFSKDNMSYVDRTFLTWHTIPISLIKQSMYILKMSNSNYCQSILTILLTTIQQNTKAHALPLIYQSIWPGFCALSIIKGAVMMMPVKSAYTGAIGVLTNTYTSQNTKQKKRFNVYILCTQETNCEFYMEMLMCKFNMEKTLYYIPNWTWWLSHTVIQHFLSFHS